MAYGIRIDQEGHIDRGHTSPYPGAPWFAWPERTAGSSGKEFLSYLLYHPEAKRSFACVPLFHLPMDTHTGHVRVP